MAESKESMSTTERKEVVEKRVMDELPGRKMGLMSKLGTIKIKRWHMPPSLKIGYKAVREGERKDV